MFLLYKIDELYSQYIENNTNQECFIEMIIFVKIFLRYGNVRDITHRHLLNKSTRD